MTHLSKVMKDINGCTFISISTKTNVKLTGGMKNPQQGLVTKITKGTNVMVFQNKSVNGYENMINKRLTKEGKNPSFEVGLRTWGTRIPNQPFIEHKSEKYLEVICLHSGKSHYEVDGVKTESTNINGLPKPHPSKQGRLDNTVQIRTYKVGSISSITINKQTFTDISY